MSVSDSQYGIEHKHGGLGQLASTAICGNDITSSCLYVSALAIIVSGRWAPVALLLVAGLLYFFRSIYSEVVGALPLNGGAYNALLNTTSKFRASIAACLTILSYMATAVLSANEAIHYLQQLWPTDWSDPTIIILTIGLLAVFMVLTIIGISESAIVAIGIFVIHIASLSLLILIGILYVLFNGISTLEANLSTPSNYGPEVAIFFGFSAALLGISGFESSANFVEQQAEGIFPKTLRNMWIAVSIFNPAMAILALAILPIGNLNTSNSNALLANIGQIVGHGKWLGWIISADAVLVLSGAVLTSFIGVNGLVHRMSLDRCLPQFLLKTTRRGTTHRIIIAFFLLSVSILLLTEGRLEALAGVYTISFLTVMALFCLGNILLKVKRQTLPRPTTAPWLYVAVALLGVVAGLIGNTFMRQSAGFFHQEGNGRIAHDAELTLTGPEGHLTFYVDEGERFSNVAQQVNQSKDKTGVTAKATQTTLVFSTMEVGSDAIIQIEVVSGQFTINDSHHRKVTNSGSDGISNLITFFWYFIPAILIVSAMLGRIALLKFCLFVLRNMISGLLNPLYTITQWIRDTIERINSQQIVFFTRGDNIANLNNAMLYVKNNEHTNRIKLVTVVKDKKEVPDKLKEDINFLNEVYPSIEIEFVILEDNFGPALIDTLSKEWNIPKNFMFIGSPAGRMMYGLAELGGVRLIV
ncbi:MAG TPA: APC family permease [Pirellulales bacterium]|jgi:amino acid transporter|nr:APC family permease [Pirellulales bacterium]